MAYGVPAAESSAREMVIGSGDMNIARVMGLFAMRTRCLANPWSWAARSDGAKAGTQQSSHLFSHRHHRPERKYPRPTGDRPQH
jgi:hypothetical protein